MEPCTFLAADAPAPYRHGLSLCRLVAADGANRRGTGGAHGDWLANASLWLIWAPVAAAVGIGAAAWAHWYVDSQGMAGDPRTRLAVGVDRRDRIRARRSDIRLARSEVAAASPRSPPYPCAC